MEHKPQQRCPSFSWFFFCFFFQGIVLTAEEFGLEVVTDSDLASQLHLVTWAFCFKCLPGMPAKLRYAAFSLADGASSLARGTCPAGPSSFLLSRYALDTGKSR